MYTPQEERKIYKHTKYRRKIEKLEDEIKGYDTAIAELEYEKSLLQEQLDKITEDIKNT